MWQLSAFCTLSTFTLSLAWRRSLFGGLIDTRRRREENVAVPRVNHIKDKDERIQNLSSARRPLISAAAPLYPGTCILQQGHPAGNLVRAEGCNFKKFPQFRSKLGPNAGKTGWSPSLEMVRVGEGCTWVSRAQARVGKFHPPRPASPLWTNEAQITEASQHRSI